MKLLNVDLNALEKGQYFGQTNPASQALALCELADQTDRFLLVVTPDNVIAEQLQRNIKFFITNKALPIEIFPDWEILPYDTFSPHQDIIFQRLHTLYHLPKQQQGMLIIPITTLLHRLTPTHYIQGQCILLNTHQKFDVDHQKKSLIEAGYAHVETVYAHGEFAIRGSLVDISPMGSHMPIRIDLFDDTIDSIRTFDSETQRTIDVVDHIELLPAHEYPLSLEGRSYFKQRFQDTFDVDVRDCPIYMDISKGLASAGAEYYLPLFFEETATLFDYLPGKTLLTTIGDIHAAGEQFWNDTQDRYENYNVNVQRPILAPHKVLQPIEQLFKAFKSYPKVSFKETVLSQPNAYNLPISSLPDIAVDARSSTPYSALTSFAQQNKRTLFIAESIGRLDHLIELLEKAGISAKSVDSWADFLKQTVPHAITVAPIDNELLLTHEHIAVVTESQILGEKVMQRRRRNKTTVQNDQMVRNLNELEIGAPVVHINHGVGRYEGLQTLNLNEQPQEFLTLTYADNAKLYVPVAHLHLIARYSGASDVHAPLNKLGSEQWSKARKKAAEKVRDVAAELLDIYARREAVKGVSFQWPESDYNSFADEFPFETTPDQQLAIDLTLQDMAKEQPMDRLICGDVGFGKTEVAMRAAFVALCQQTQIAILAPTTLLAQQHYDTFCDRFAEWPAQIDVLSRFKSNKQTDQIKQNIANGNIDIIIGTHKLLSEDVKFKDLGLLVVDEEHRFGVRQKERMKSFRSQVNILTLTATPIPRTLNMAMSSIRDLSIIATPPAKRLSINTFIYKHSNQIIKEAIMRELLRGGQVYYLHNDVKTIEKAAGDLQQLIPEARIDIGHGQMRERQLEKVMQYFYHKRTNILVCTTIIETGIDIPSANTIVIHRADKFGLAQLHQLRGRVGRSHHQAYAYLLIPEEQKITNDAQKRLDAIVSTTELGSGFMLATHDLEIRGAGELLGEDQSGQITSVGFSLYMDMLERAVKALRKGEIPSVEESIIDNTEVNLRIPTLIPENYIASTHTRLVTYKRIASCENAEQLQEMQAEIVDRFGLLPKPASYLFRVTLLKLKSQALGIDKIEVNSQYGKLTFADHTTISPSSLIALIQKEPRRYQLQGSTMLRYNAEMPDADQRFNMTEQLLEKLIA